MSIKSKNTNGTFALFTFSLLFGALFSLSAAPIKIVAAENCYGDVAAEVGGPMVEVVSIMNNPNQDPHEFQSDAATARAVAEADVIIENGLGYDSWMQKLLAASGKKKFLVITVADLVNAKSGANPHLWYDPSTMLMLAKKIAEALHKPEAAAAFLESMKPLQEKIASLRLKTNGMKVTATEPVFNYMASALGMEMLNEGYQQAIMNETEPTFQQTVAIEQSLRTKTARFLFSNSQVSNAATTRLLAIATKAGVPIISVTETQPPTEKSYVHWMLSELQKIEKTF